MHRNVLLLAIASTYYFVATYALITFDVGLLFTSLTLFGLPAYLLARYSAAPGWVLLCVAVFGAGIAVLLEGIAHLYGVWYTLGVDELRLFGLIPLEVILSTVIQTLFLALLYELIFDDGQYVTVKETERMYSFGVFTVSVLLLVGIHQYLLNGIYFSHSYIWIIGILVGSTLATLAVTHSLTLRFFDRLALFTVVASVPLFLSLMVAVGNTHKIFAHTNDYLYTITVFGNIVPIEEILMLLVLPLFVATFYELYLDDKSVA
jgi:hypothetical protein